MPVNQLTGDAPVSVDGITIDAPGLTGEVVVETGAGATRRGVGDQVPDQIRLAVRRHGGRARRTIRIESPSDAELGAKGETRGLKATPVDGRRGRPTAMRIAVPALPTASCSQLKPRLETPWQSLSVIEMSRSVTAAPAAIAKVGGNGKLF